MEYYFYQLAYWDSKVPKCFVGLIQIQCSPSFESNWGKQNDRTTSWHQLHPRYWVLQQEKCLGYPPDCVGVVTDSQNCVLECFVFGKAIMFVSCNPASAFLVMHNIVLAYDITLSNMNNAYCQIVLKLPTALTSVSTWDTVQF